MYKTFVEYKTGRREYFYEGDDIIKAMRVQGELIKKYKNDSGVYSIGYENK